jgi:hypothetical protein
MIATLAQLTENQRAVRDHFAEGGSILAAALVAAGVLAIFFVAYVLTRRQEHARRDAVRNNPLELFQTLLGALELSAAQRRLLGTIAKDSGLANPAVLLLSPTLFRSHVDRWKERERGAADEKLLRSTSKILFPNKPRP